ncbi:MAG: lipid A phosphoethanolamine transferase, partial [Muribaculaceae bacterium]|nr:lipid A phosphoethanolamine transferase [Muribaculaceae bacterium]
SERQSRSLPILALTTAVLLTIPGILLAFADHQTIVTGLLSVLFPFSVYLLIISLWRRTGWGVLCTLPFMILGAFQIVLLYLYGESIIAVDMFINVTTTDVQEATTLLEQLMPAIVTVCVLYLPPIIWAIISLKSTRPTMNHYKRLLLIYWSSILFLVSGTALLVCSLFNIVVPGNDIFPINVIRNIAIAVERVSVSKKYPESAREYKFNATLRPEIASDSIGRTVIAVIGETARADRWQLYGFERETNPRLSKRSGIITMMHPVSQSNTTHKSVPMMLTALNAETFEQLPYTRSLITAFKEAGYSTAYFSNQPPNGSYNQHIGEEADTTFFFERKIGTKEPDTGLAGLTSEWLAQDTTRFKLIVLHTYGAHFPYTDHYTPDQAVFTPDSPLQAKASNRENLLNAYDNATIAVDLALDSIISVLEAQNCHGAMIYAADHGEDIFDDSRNKFLHASPIPTAWQIYVPMILWTSPGFLSAERLETLQRNAGAVQSPSETFFHTAIDLGGVETPVFQCDKSLISDSLKADSLLYLNDRNQSVRITECGLKESDIDHLKRWHISAF